MTRRALVAAAVVLATVGCQRTLSLPGPGGVDGPPAVASLLARHAARLQSVRGDAVVSVRIGEEGGTAQQVVVAERPDRLRLETLGAFGQPALVFAASSDGASLFVASEGRLYRGPGVARRAAFLPQGLAVEDVVAALLGTVPPGALAGAAAGRLEVLGRARQYRLDAVDPATGSTWRVLVSADDGRPVQASRLGDDGTPAVTATFEDFRPSPAGPFPYRIRLVEPARALDARIEYGEIEVNVPVSAAAFRLATPRGADIVEVE